MQISSMFTEQLSRRHVVNTPLLPADVEQCWCPRVTLNRSFRWSLWYYATDILEKLFPRLYENCQWDVSFRGKTGSKQCIFKGSTHRQELPFATSSLCCTVLGAEPSAASPCQTAAQHTPVVVSQCAALLQKRFDLPFLHHYKGNAFILVWIVFILANQISFGVKRTEI